MPRGRAREVRGSCFARFRGRIPTARVVRPRSEAEMLRSPVRANRRWREGPPALSRFSICPKWLRSRRGVFPSGRRRARGLSCARSPAAGAARGSGESGGNRRTHSQRRSLTTEATQKGPRGGASEPAQPRRRTKPRSCDATDRAAIALRVSSPQQLTFNSESRPRTQWIVYRDLSCLSQGLIVAREFLAKRFACSGAL